jgi:hypothetical protein
LPHVHAITQPTSPHKNNDNSNSSSSSSNDNDDEDDDDDDDDENHSLCKAPLQLSTLDRLAAGSSSFRLNNSTPYRCISI